MSRTAAKKYFFEDRWQTAKDVARVVTAYGLRAITTYLDAGARSRSEFSRLEHQAIDKRLRSVRRSAHGRSSYYVLGRG